MSEELTDDDLQAMLDRCDSADAPPWMTKWDFNVVDSEGNTIAACGGRTSNVTDYYYRNIANANFIAGARTDFPRVIRKLQAARKREAAKDAVIEAARKLAEWAMEWADETDLGELHGGLINAVRALPQARVVFLAGAAWGGEEAAKIADKYPGVYGNSPTAAAIREHFGAISKHYDLTNEEPK